MENSRNNLIKSFVNNKFGNVRVVLISDNKIPYFVGKDVAKCLGYTTLERMYDHVDKQDKMKINPQSIEYQGLCENGITLEPNENVFTMVLINESGLYDAIFSSTLETAKEFKRWVTTEVLPSIRKTGSYNGNMLANIEQSNKIAIDNCIAECKAAIMQEYKERIDELKVLTNRIDKTEKLIGIRQKKVFDYGKYIRNKMGIRKSNKNYENVKMVLFAELNVSLWEEIDYSMDIIVKIDEVLNKMKLDEQISFF